MLAKDIMRTQLYSLTPDFLRQDWIKDHRRWACYLRWGLQCCVPDCKRVGTHVIHWYSPYDFKKYGDIGRGEHIDLIGYEPNGDEFLMTVDHIVPKSYGGPKVWWNLQPMCVAHNNGQKNRMVFKPDRDRLLLIMEQTGIPTMLGPDKYSDEQLHRTILEWYQEKYPMGRKK